jgi:hypothetical protein
MEGCQPDSGRGKREKSLVDLSVTYDYSEERSFPDSKSGWGVLVEEVFRDVCMGRR